MNSRDNLIVDMQSPTPIDVFKYNSKGVIDIYISKLDGKNYTIDIRDSSIDKPILLENCTNAMRKVWQLIEMFRKKAFVDKKIVNVYDIDSKTSYKKISLATTLKQEEVEEAIERQRKLAVSSRRRFGNTPFHSRRSKKVDMRVYDRSRYASSSSKGIG